MLIMPPSRLMGNLELEDDSLVILFITTQWCTPFYVSVAEYEAITLQYTLHIAASSTVFLGLRLREISSSIPGESYESFSLEQQLWIWLICLESDILNWVIGLHGLTSLFLFYFGGFHLFCRVLFVFNGGLPIFMWLEPSTVASKYVGVGIIFFSDGLFFGTRVVHTIHLGF
ncbi:transmembrane protein, putative [Medicago truncatula]|uniref:Transmembrane protein, putative n=1 Tax=Medicago truncatula TaxID=3880 RepID=A0A072TWZ5_MEDTR|nr:transmembrane protein, putative [Medicago truncatula]